MIAELWDIKKRFLKLRKHNLDPRCDVAKCFGKYGKAIQDMAESILQVRSQDDDHDDDEIPLHVKEGFDSASQMEWFHSSAVLDYCREIDETIAKVTKVSPPKKAGPKKRKAKDDLPNFNILSDSSEEGKYLLLS